MHLEHPGTEHKSFSFSHRNRAQMVKQTATRRQCSSTYPAQKRNQITRRFFTHFPDVCKNKTTSALCKIKAKMEVTKRYCPAEKDDGLLASRKSGFSRKTCESLYDYPLIYPYAMKGFKPRFMLDLSQDSSEAPPIKIVKRKIYA